MMMMMIMTSVYFDPQWALTHEGCLRSPPTITCHTHEQSRQGPAAAYVIPPPGGGSIRFSGYAGTLGNSQGNSHFPASIGPSGNHWEPRVVRHRWRWCARSSRFGWWSRW